MICAHAVMPAVKAFLRAGTSRGVEKVPDRGGDAALVELGDAPNSPLQITVVETNAAGKEITLPEMNRDKKILYLFRPQL